MSKFLFYPHPVATGTEYKIKISIILHFASILTVNDYIILVLHGHQYYIRQAVEAKQRLLEIIEEKVKERKCEFLKVFDDNKGTKICIMGFVIKNII